MTTDYGRCLTARATHASHRANLRCLGLSVGIAIALAGCNGGDPHANPIEGALVQGRVVHRGYVEGGVVKFCDHGRAVYVSKNGYAGGIAVAEGAPECASGTEARRAETVQHGSVHDGPTVEDGDAPEQPR